MEAELKPAFAPTQTDHAGDPELTIDPESGVAEAEVGAVRRWVDAGEVLMIDVREAEEFEREWIPGSLLMPLSLFDPEQFPRALGVKVVVVCAIGKRSRAVAKQLRNAGYPQPINMIGGLVAWKEAGYPTEV